MADIRFKHVAKRFGDVSVIEDFNLEIADQEFIVLVGPSGCGKSTILRMIAGLEALSDGELFIGGRLVNDVPPKDRDVAMVFQSYALYPHMTVRDNISFGLRIRKMPAQEIEVAVKEAAGILGLGDLLSRKPKELSGGQRQRVALGRAIVRKPAVFLFDEPLSNLDAELRVQMRAELSKLQDRLKTTTVYVTHDQVEAMTLGDRIAVLKAGKLMQMGKPLELYNTPQNIFVARFIGSPPMNMLRVTVNADGRSVRHAAFTAPVPERLHPAVAPYRGKDIMLGIRSEHIGEAGRQDWQSTVEFDGVIEIFEPLGHEIIVYVRSGEERILAKFEATRLPAMGQTIRLTLNADKIHLFDPQTEQRLGKERSNDTNEGART
ncbi:MAG: sn-glycerol-3-phosphate ABC transporter ATP-binding protein UgpC [Gammaproteobacteria bacterium]|nr:sn-glycerol-3-phosphate ABC transporter ATP-binding protein UgpC [Gammaproteobacteria bacterium]